MQPLLCLVFVLFGVEQCAVSSMYSGCCGFPEWLVGCLHHGSQLDGRDITCVFSSCSQSLSGRHVSLAPPSCPTVQCADVKPGSFAGVIQVLRSVGALQHISELRKLNVSSVSQLWALCEDSGLWAEGSGFGRPQKFARRVSLEVGRQAQ